jgi:DNA-directed RNA polymerase specialized sigma24 family protein
MLEQFVRRRVPGDDVEDLVQTVLCDALDAERIPRERAELRKWLVGIARHKVADYHRRSGRERPSELGDLEAEPPPVEERQMVEWAEQQAHSSRDARQTLEWMAREGEGEKLASIAAEAKLAPTQVRQRVSRMRRWMKERWLAELATAAAVLLLALMLWQWLRRPTTNPENIRPDEVASTKPPEPTPIERARALRAEAEQACQRSEWQPCLDRLDEARRLDPAGDASSDVTGLRERAQRALAPEPAPTASDSAPLDSKDLPPTPKQPPPDVTTPPPTTASVPAPTPSATDSAWHGSKEITLPDPSATSVPSSTPSTIFKGKGDKTDKPKVTPKPTGTGGTNKTSSDPSGDYPSSYRSK